MQKKDIVVPCIRIALIVNNLIGLFFLAFCAYGLRTAPLILVIMFAVSSAFNLFFGALTILKSKRRVKFGRKPGFQGKSFYTVASL